MAEEIKPAAGRVPVSGEGSWSVGLFDCPSDLGLCCISCFCPCITFGQISEIVDRGSCSCMWNGTLYACIAYFTCLAQCYSCFYRSKLRRQYSIPGSLCGDCCAHFCCESCALRQEYLELQNRGFDMWIGWAGNLERKEKNQGIQIHPPVTGEMVQ